MKWAGLCKPKCFGGLGFREMVAFNKALLANQVWRILQKPHSLMAQILKDRYFKNLDIMEADLGSNPSFVWRSIVWSRDIIRRGLCWRVGNGKSISVISDPWIPGIAGFRSNHSAISNHSTKVDTLINTNGMWNESLIRFLFIPVEAESIMDITLNRRGCSDSRIWTGSTNGIYSVKASYFLEAKGFDPPQFQSSHSLQAWWKLLWKLCIPPKVKVFMWRASKTLSLLL